MYTLMSDSNVDWNQALPEVKRFAERRGLKDVAMDNYGISDDVPYVPQSHPWDCQAPGRQMGAMGGGVGEYDSGCEQLRVAVALPREELAGGGMYAFHLPEEIPAAGTAGGPPVESERRTFLGMPFDFKAVTLEVLRNPETIPQVMKEMTAKFSPPQK